MEFTRVKEGLGNFVNLYLLKRLIFAFFTIWVIATIIFLMTTVLPGGAAEMMLGQAATPEKVAALEAELGLDQPLHVRYVDWLGGILTGDWGESFRYKTSVLNVIWPRLIRTFQLAIIGTLITVGVSIPVGVLAAARHGSKTDTFISSISYVFVGVPSFVSGTMLILLLAGGYMDIFPTGGYTPFSEDVISWFMHLLLPSVTLAILVLAHLMRQTRAGMLEALNSEYVRTARLKGLAENTVLFKHALRNGLLPVITIIALNFGWMMGSLVVVEEVFNYPGLGQLIVTAIANRDVPLIQMAIFIPTASYVFANLGADILYAYLDSRISFGGGS